MAKGGIVTGKVDLVEMRTPRAVSDLGLKIIAGNLPRPLIVPENLFPQETYVGPIHKIFCIDLDGKERNRDPMYAAYHALQLKRGGKGYIDRFLKENGWRFEHSLRDERLGEGLVEVAEELSRGEFRQILVIDGDVALSGYRRRGQETRLRDPRHFVYARGHTVQTDEERSVKVITELVLEKRVGAYSLRINGILSE